ncbi:MAG: DUF1549 domain-containing protein [Planctomycetota bacterium]
MIRRLAFLLLPLLFASRLVAEEGLFASVAEVLSARCLACHDEEDSEGGLSMVDPTRLLDSELVVAGQPDSSRLLEVVTVRDGTHEMPKDAVPLDATEVAAIREWIEAGAEVPRGLRLQVPRIADLDWWSLKPIQESEVPESIHPVDWFVEQKLDAKGLMPLGQAGARTLFRRITYDLTGLPPSPTEIEAFVDDFRRDPEQAWVNVVDRLLADPAFGEKWGQHWLDVARYAETHGYDKDKPRMNAWPYRDYVIESFNQDKPYDVFIREQIAGDRVATDRATGIIATGFLAAGPWDFIGHVEVGEGKLDGRIAKHLDRDEIVSAVFNVFQSTTIQCAQCHDHKFDPIASEDYYRVHAVFAAIDRADRVYAGLNQEQIQRKRELESQRSGVRRLQARAERELRNTVAREAREIDPRIEELEASADRVPPSRHGFHSTISKDRDVTKWVQVDLGSPVKLDRIELVACYDEFNNIGEGFGFPTRFKIEVTDAETFADGGRVLADHTTTDFANPRSRPVSFRTDGRPVRLIRVTGSRLAERKDDFILALAELRAVQSDGSVASNNCLVSASDAIPSNDRWSPAFLVDGEYMPQSLEDAELEELVRLHSERDAIEQSKRTPAFEARMKFWNKQLSTVQEELRTFPRGQLVFAATTDFEPQGQFRSTGGKARPIHFLRRGDVSAPGARLLPGIPRLWESSPTGFATKPGFDESSVRAALAESISRRDNPLTWRSMANRIWQWTFSRPLVATPNDFGRMGGKPTHPELLDFLAARLRDDPARSVKSLVRLLVTSRAYRRSSLVTEGPELRRNWSIDSENETLWRFHRRRLTAEEIRDTVLLASGALRRDRGGPSFLDFVIERPAHSPHYEYHLYDPSDEKSHRRSIYRFVVRSQPNPLLMTLDCADPSISVARRDESTTAIQALAQWNHQLIEYHAARFAKRLGEEPVREACTVAWGRAPSSEERALLEKLRVDQGLETMCRVVLNANALVYVD